MWECLTARQSFLEEGKQLFIQLRSYLSDKATGTYQRAKELPDDSLREFYSAQQEKWNESAKKNQRVFRFFERHWIGRELTESHIDVDGIPVCKIVDLHADIWRVVVFHPLEERLAHCSIRAEI